MKTLIIAVDMLSLILYDKTQNVGKQFTKNIPILQRIFLSIFVPSY